MYGIYFYRDRNGREPVADYIERLLKRGDKSSRIKAQKINDYIEVLSMCGTRIGEPYVKHLDGDIWELRPIRDRVLFAAWQGDNFILLHSFTKKTQKTPPREIEKAKRELADILERSIAWKR